MKGSFFQLIISWTPPTLLNYCVSRKKKYIRTWSIILKGLSIFIYIRDFPRFIILNSLIFEYLSLFINFILFMFFSHFLIKLEGENHNYCKITWCIKFFYYRLGGKNSIVIFIYLFLVAILKIVFFWYVCDH